MKKKVLVLVLALVLVLGLGMGAYADPNDTVVPYSYGKTVDM